MGLGLGPFELILVFAVLLLMFGARKLPDLATGMGKGIRGFKQALNGLDEPPAMPDPAPYPAVAAPPAPLAEVQAAGAAERSAAGEPSRPG